MNDLLSDTLPPLAHDETIDGQRARAPYSHRIVAKLIDLSLAILVAQLKWPIAIAVGVGYLLIADTFGLGQSAGKRLLRLRVIHPQSGQPCGLRGAVLRNLLLVIPFACLHLGLLLQIVGLVAGLFIAGYEVVLLVRDPYGVRIGDILGSTEVIKLDADIREPVRKPTGLRLAHPAVAREALDAGHRNVAA